LPQQQRKTRILTGFYVNAHAVLNTVATANGWPNDAPIPI